MNFLQNLSLSFFDEKFTRIYFEKLNKNVPAVPLKNSSRDNVLKVLKVKVYNVFRVHSTTFNKDLAKQSIKITVNSLPYLNIRSINL